MAIHIGPRPLQFVPGLDCAGAVATRARLRSVGAESLRHLLLRQDLHPAILVSADVLSGRPARRLPVLSLCATAAAREGRGYDPTSFSWSCRERRGLAARHRAGFGQE